MALRLRRGTDAERLLITPVEGELIYTTDTKLLYVGDGTTVGGIIATGQGGASDGSLAGLSDTAVAGVVDGQQLVWNAGLGRWVPGDKTLNSLNDVIVAGATDGQVLTWDNGISTWVASDPTGGSSELSDLTDVDTLGVSASDLLQYDGVEWIAKSIDEVLLGYNFNGAFDGDLKGSVFGDNSSVIVDGINNTITTTSLSSYSVSTNLISEIEATGIVIKSGSPNGTGLIYNGITTGAFGGETSLIIDSSKGTLDVPQDTLAGDTFGALKVRGYNGESYVLGSLQQTFWDSTADFSETYPKSGWRLAVNAGDGNGTLKFENGNPTGFNHMTLRSDGALEGPIFKMLVADDAADRDVEVPTPEAGMMVFVTDGDGLGNPKFQGYDGTSWVNLN